MSLKGEKEMEERQKDSFWLPIGFQQYFQSWVKRWKTENDGDIKLLKNAGI